MQDTVKKVAKELYSQSSSYVSPNTECNTISHLNFYLFIKINPLSLPEIGHGIAQGIERWVFASCLLL
jgi:hypothetical protein